MTMNWQNASAETVAASIFKEGSLRKTLSPSRKAATQPDLCRPCALARSSGTAGPCRSSFIGRPGHPGSGPGTSTRTGTGSGTGVAATSKRRHGGRRRRDRREGRAGPLTYEPAGLA